MKILLDEDVPKQAVGPLAHIVRPHAVQHVHSLGWSGKSDRQILQDAATRGFDMLVTNDRSQLDDPHETRFIKASGMHHVTYRQRRHGLQGLGLALGAVFAALPAIVNELDGISDQRLVTIAGLDPRSRYKVVDPRQDPPRYWPR